MYAAASTSLSTAFAKSLSTMTAAFTAAVAALPAPKMVYSEFNDFTQEVATYNELAAVE